MERPSKGRPVVVCTTHRGVFFGFAEDTSGSTVHLLGSRMAIRWGTTDGVMQLAKSGPTDKSKIGAECDADLRDVTAVFECTEEATEKWLSA